jgi:thymidylate synthase (FAD)
MIEVTLIDYMGTDLSVVNAARVSFGKKHTEFDEVRDSKLIKYLAREKHYSPFNHTYVTFHVKAPIFVARQLVKHEYMA